MMTSRSKLDFAALGRCAVAILLCVLLVDQSLLAAVLPPAGAVPPTVARELHERERVVHALNRLTFGPRPGDVAAVQSMGLDRWFEAQLHPEQIDDSKLGARLSEYPAMQMSIADLERRYPGPAVIRAIADGKASLPSDPEVRALVQQQLAFYKMQRARQAETKSMNSTGTTQTGTPDDAAQMAAEGSANKSRRRAIADGLAALEDENTTSRGTSSADKALPAREIAPDSMVSGGAPSSPADARALQAERAGLINLPPAARMQALFAMAPGDLLRLQQGSTAEQKAALADGLTPQQKELLLALPGSLRMVALESMEARVTRDVYSERQLEAVMTDFWLNHFNVYVRKNQIEPFLLPSYERETIRPHALGNFEDLLVATAKSPAMLVYLDNFRSTGPDSQQAERIRLAQDRNSNGKVGKQASVGLNENYGRELMELHTLGVGGGYTQADVTMVAKVFTGWTVDKPYQGGGFTFEERRHEPGTKTVLGNAIHENGQKEGLEVLHMLATSPATAHFISQKLAVRFVSDNPPAELVDRMAQSFLASRGDIKIVLRTMFHAPEFWSPAVYRAKVKTPEEYVISAVRASGAEVSNPQTLVSALDKLGMPLYGMQTPNGYSWMQGEWVGTGALVTRMNFALVLSGDRLPGIETRWSALLGDPAATAIKAAYVPTGSEDAVLQAKERRLEQLLLEQPASDRTRETVLRQSTDANVTAQAETQFDLRGGGGRRAAGRGTSSAARPQGLSADDPQAAVMAGLLLGSPEFQRR